GCRHGDHVEYVLGAASARKIVRGFGKSLQNRPDGHRAANPLRDLVADVSRFQVREYEDVRVAAKRRVARLHGRDLGDEGRIELQGAIDAEIRVRSEERRVGKEGNTGSGAQHTYDR